jgi:hypothetical protein
VRIGLVVAKKQFFTAKNRDIPLILRHLIVIFYLINRKVGSKDNLSEITCLYKE